eukprot:Hpha_TRINITY_DN16721_c0_g7::TRINITY_DN16721_c0_g7_i1::g.77418::m.77418
MFPAVSPRAGVIDPNAVKLRLGIVIAVGAFIIVGLLGIVVGGLQQDNASERMQMKVRGVNQMVRERLALCEQERKRLRTGREGAKVSVQKLTMEGKLLGRENELLHQTNEDLEKETGVCVEERAKLLESITGTRESNATAVIERLRNENIELSEALGEKHSSASRKSGRLRAKVLALRLENTALQNDLRARRTRTSTRGEVAAVTGISDLSDEPDGVV